MRFAIGHRHEIGKRGAQYDGADTDAGCGGYPLDKGERLRLLAQQPADGVACSCMIDRACELGANGNEKRHLVAIE